MKNVGPIRYCEPFYIVIHQVSLLSHASYSYIAQAACDVHDDDDDDDDNDDNDDS